MKLRVIYNEGVVKVKEKGKKSYYIPLPIVDKYRNFSLSVMKNLCKHLFNEVKYVEEIDPEVYNLLPPIENIVTPTELLKIMSKRNVKLKNVGLEVSKPNERILEKYKLLERVNFWIIFYYRGKSWMTSIITWDRRSLENLEEKVKVIGKELTSFLLEIYSQCYSLKVGGELNEKSIEKLLEKYFPLKKKSEELKKEKCKKMKKPIFEIEEKKKIEQRVKQKKVKIKKKVKISKEVPYEIVESEVKRFLKSESINFFDRVVKSKINQINIEKLDESQKRELYKLIYEYVSSRNSEAQKKFVREANLKFIGLLHDLYYK